MLKFSAEHLVTALPSKLPQRHSCSCCPSTSLVPRTRSKPTAFEAVSFQQGLLSGGGKTSVVMKRKKSFANRELECCETESSVTVESREVLGWSCRGLR